MTKEQWLQIRSQEEVKMETWWEYYKDNNGIIGDFPTFAQAFSQLIFQPQIIVTRTGPKNINYDGMIHRLYNYYDDKFDTRIKEQEAS